MGTVVLFNFLPPSLLLPKLNEHGRYLYDLVKDRVPAKFEIIAGITHFEI